MEQRQALAEQNQQKIQQTQRDLVATINRLLTGQYLPGWLSEFIRQRLAVDFIPLKVTAEGKATVDLWLDLLRHLAWAYKSKHASEHEAHQHQSRVYEELPGVIDTIDQRFLVGLPDRQAYEQILESVMASLVDCIRKGPEEAILFKPINTEITTEKLKLSTTKGVKESLTLTVNEWYFIRNLGEPSSTHKLFAVDAAKDLYQFSDYYGKSTQSLTGDQVTLLTATKKLLPVPCHSELFFKMVTAFIQYEEKRAQRALTAAQHRTEQPKPISDTTEQQNSGSPAAESNPSALTQDHAQPLPTGINDELATSVIVKSEQEIAQFADQIKSLQLGAWLQFRQQEPEQQKLTLKLPSSDKYVFTDRWGRKTGEYRLQELLDRYARDLLSILSQGEQFDSKLEQIVRGQRR
ncbi:DUF1631 family protein [Halioxenophilus sp. WMMB6]|uniref:DUF1631 family protein n=1 Tax=Halioxenophilus sp. WMMB6 TaxID=3073815 RepID=UPI00295F479E|nr:DUF1631 family protein [Halioxenophilus sp. WMMB6]